MSNIDLAIADRALLTQIAEQAAAFYKHNDYATSQAKWPAKAQLVAVAKRKAKDAENVGKVLVALSASSKAQTRHPLIFGEAMEGNVDAVIDYFDNLAAELHD